MTILILLLIGGGWYFTTSDERKRIAQACLQQIRGVKKKAIRVLPARESFCDTLRERTPLAIVTPALVLLNVVVFIAMLTGTGSLGDPDTLVSWGGTFGPRTTNGEWWRLMTAIFVHTGVIHVAVNMAGLLQIGLILERLFGRLAFVGVYLAAGLFSNLIGLAAHPVAVVAGSSGAIFGIYGLLAAWLIAAWVFGSTVSIPLATLKRIAPAGGVFILYSLLAGYVGAAEIAGLFVGVGYGLVLARGASEHVPPALRVGIPMGAVVVLIVTSAVPLRGMANVGPEIEHVIAVEDQTSKAYDAAIHHLTRGVATTDELSQLIDRTILPQVQKAHARINELQRVPREQAPLVDGAVEYFRLREESWRIRSEGLRKTSAARLKEADRAERAALEALDKIKAGD